MKQIDVEESTYLQGRSLANAPSVVTGIAFNSRRGYVTLDEGDNIRHKVVASTVNEPRLEQLDIFPQYLRSPDQLFLAGNPEQAVYASDDKHFCLDDAVLWEINNEALHRDGDTVTGHSVLGQEFGYDLNKLRLASIGPTDFALMPYMLEQERVRFEKEGQITKLMHGIKVLHSSSMPLSCPTLTAEGPVCLEDWGKHPRFTTHNQYRIVGALKGEVFMQGGPTDFPYTTYDGKQNFVQLNPEGLPVRGF